MRIALLGAGTDRAAPRTAAVGHGRRGQSRGRGCRSVPRRGCRRRTGRDGCAIDRCGARRRRGRRDRRRHAGPCRADPGRRSAAGCRRSARSRSPPTSTTRCPSRPRSTAAACRSSSGSSAASTPATARRTGWSTSGSSGRSTRVRLAGHDPEPASRVVHRGSGRHVPRFFHPRFRYPPLADRLRGGGGLCRRWRPGLPGVREVRRRRHGRGDPADDGRAVRRPDRHAPRSARLRHPGGAVRFARQRRRRVSGRARRSAPSSRACHRRPARPGPTSWTASRRPTAPSSPSSSASRGETFRARAWPRTASRPCASPRRRRARSTSTGRSDSRRSQPEPTILEMATAKGGGTVE